MAAQTYMKEELLAWFTHADLLLGRHNLIGYYNLSVDTWLQEILLKLQN